MCMPSSRIASASALVDAGRASKYKDSLPFWSPNLTRRAQQEAWFEEVAMFAEQAGVDGMGYPWDGDWCDEDASDSGSGI